jgi:methyl-accepting chemotaxis protein
MQAYASANGLTTLYKDMSQAEQATLRYKKVMESLSSVQGAFVANSNTFSGQLKILKANFADLGNTISKVMQVVLLPAIQVLNSIVSAISGVIKGIAGIFGLDFNGISSQTVSNLGDMSDSASDLADSENDAADGINKAAKAAKKALAPFHKLNILQSSDSSSSSSGGQAKNLNNVLGSLENTVEGSVPTIQDMLNNFANWLENLDIIKELSSFVEGINNWLDKAIDDVRDFYDALQPFIKLIAGVFNYLVENIKGEKIGELFAEVFGGAARSINTFLENLHAGSFGIFVADIVNGVAQTKSAFEELGNLISNLVNKKADFQLGFWTEADVSD